MPALQDGSVADLSPPSSHIKHDSVVLPSSVEDTLVASEVVSWGVVHPLPISQRGVVVRTRVLQDSWVDAMRLLDKYAKYFETYASAAKVTENLSSNPLAWFSAKTVTAHAVALGIDRKTLVTKSELYAAALLVSYYQMFRAQIKWLCQLFRAAGGICSTLFCFKRYDETPLKIALLDIERILQVADADALNKLLQENFKSLKARDHGLAKLLVLELSIVAKYRWHTGRWYIFRWKIPCLVSLLHFLRF